MDNPLGVPVGDPGDLETQFDVPETPSTAPTADVLEAFEDPLIDTTAAEETAIVPDPSVVRDLLANPFFSRRLKRILTRLEIARMGKIKKLHHTLHQGPEAMRILVSGGVLGTRT